MSNIQLHPFQTQAIFSEKRIISMIAGLQSGKTFAGATWLRIQTAKFIEKEDNFLITFPTYKIGLSSTLPAFLRLHSDMGTLNKTEWEFKFQHGPKCYLRSMDNPWSAEGITNTRAVWNDEAGLINTQAWININGRAAPRQSQIFNSTTPYQLNNFLFRDLYEPWKAGKRDDLEIVQFRSIDNPYFPKEEYYRQKELLDPRVFSMRYEGQFERMAGLVYQDFDWNNYLDPEKLDMRYYRIFAGIDWGYTDPFAIVIRAISTDGARDYQIAEYKRTGHTIDEHLTITKQFNDVFKPEMWYADGADPGAISYFSRSGIPIVACSNKSLELGIALHQTLIRKNIYKIFRGKCPETEKEYESYQYKDFDMDSIGEIKPLDTNNHLMDANRYVTVDTQKVRDAGVKEFMPAKTHLQRLLDGEYATVSKDAEEW